MQGILMNRFTTWKMSQCGLLMDRIFLDSTAGKLPPEKAHIWTLPTVIASWIWKHEYLAKKSAFSFNALTCGSGCTTLLYKTLMSWRILFSYQLTITKNLKRVQKNFLSICLDRSYILPNAYNICCLDNYAKPFA